MTKTVLKSIYIYDGETLSEFYKIKSFLSKKDNDNVSDFKILKTMIKSYISENNL